MKAASSANNVCHGGNDVSKLGEHSTVPLTWVGGIAIVVVAVIVWLYATFALAKDVDDIKTDRIRSKEAYDKRLTNVERLQWRMAEKLKVDTKDLETPEGEQ